MPNTIHAIAKTLAIAPETAAVKYSLTSSLLDVWALPGGKRLRFAAWLLRSVERRTGVSVLESGPTLASNAAPRPERKTVRLAKPAESMAEVVYGSAVAS